MASFTWPLDPSINFTLSERPQDGAIRTPMDSGASKSRPRFTGVSRYVTATVHLSQSERVAFDAFFFDTLSQGTSAFEMADPRDGVTRDWCFTGVPTFQGLKADNGVVTRWMATLQLEILP